nr:MAG TPA: hypothetical protein [Caudoviricetes sp.]
MSSLFPVGLSSAERVSSIAFSIAQFFFSSIRSPPLWGDIRPSHRPSSTFLPRASPARRGCAPDLHRRSKPSPTFTGHALHHTPLRFAQHHGTGHNGSRREPWPRGRARAARGGFSAGKTFNR